MGDGFVVLVETFIKDSERHLEKLHVAIADNNCDSLRAHAHSFKGSSSSLGASRCAELCRQLETMARNNQADDARQVLEELQSAYCAARAELENIQA